MRRKDPEETQRREGEANVFIDLQKNKEISQINIPIYSGISTSFRSPCKR